MNEYKELISAITETNLYQVLVDREDVTEILWLIEQDGWRKGEPILQNVKRFRKGLNPYELMGMAKVWALGKGYEVYSGPNLKSKTWSAKTVDISTTADSELIAVLSCCQTIFEKENPQKRDF